MDSDFFGWYRRSAASDLGELGYREVKPTARTNVADRRL
jgi:hypothetical protein